MKTVIINIPDKKEDLLLSFLKKNHFKSRILKEEELEDEALAKWIDEGMKSKDVPIEKVFQLLEKHGAKGQR
jgi:hypothetical protein